MDRLFTINVDVFVPRLLTKRGPKKVAFVVEMFLVTAKFTVVVEVNDALEV